MTEVIAVGASIIAVVQITDRVIELCKYWIEIWRDAPADLRAILVEMLTTKTILDGAQFLISCNKELSATLESLVGANGPIEGCRSTIAELEGLFPSNYTQGSSGNRSKRQKVKASLAVLAWPLKENKARKLLKKVTRHRATISLALTMESTCDTKDIKRKTTQVHKIISEKQRQRVYEWLQVIDPSPLHHRACRVYEHGTGDWMPRSPEWAHWIEGKARCIWVHGIAGAGKTVLASHLIEKTKEYCAELTTGKYAYIYYYCYFGHNQEEAAPFLRWTINRLCRETDLVPPGLYKLYRHGGEPSLVELLCTLEAVLENFAGVYIIIDAIDESMLRDDLLRKIQLLATSREYIDIEKVMQQISVSVSMSNPLVDEDIKQYIRSQLNTSSKFKHWSPDLCDEVLEALSAKAKGMFRWATCQIDVLQRLKGESTIIKDALAYLPKTLDETYERVFLGIPEEDRMFVLHAMKWIYFNNELLNENISCPILLQAIERTTGELKPFRRDRFYDEERLRELCGCLITVAPQERKHSHYIVRTVSFAHYTVWEFLNSARILNSSAAIFAVTEETREELMRSVILEVLNTPRFDLPYPNRPLYHPDIGKIFEEHLHLYCVTSSMVSLKRWGPEISKQDNLMVLAFSMLDPSKPHFKDFAEAAYYIDSVSDLFIELKIFDVNKFWDVSWKTVPERTDAATIVNILLLCGKTELTEKFLGNVDMQDVLQTPLDLVPGSGNHFTAGLGSHRFQGSIIELFAQLT